VPAVLIALLAIAINLIADALTQALGGRESEVATR
jgi:ABC-type dipeptide/oligopeptide/nickel transport system permease subunit